ncbi:MAG: aminotransferase class III-fold pyridoxal phosphate-dependent enzyme [bacterium]|nr:aminotransferase class III-fold pyridoxal phosphate-dependent enzyme [bacterium]
MSAGERLLGWYQGVVDEYRRLTPRSAALFVRGGGVLPGGDTRYSITTRPHPPYFDRGEGPHIWDVDGNRRLDLNNNSTALVHGHAHPEIVAAVRSQAGSGTAWGGHNPSELDWADIICERVPSIERVRFANSGTEANMHMLKVARAFTGRDLVLKLDGAYHGTYDAFEFASGQDGHAAASTGGVPANLAENVVLGAWGDTDGVAALVREHADQLAAVILTPFRSAGGFAHPPEGFLETLRAVTADEGVLLLFDEVISLRLAMGGAQDRYGVVPDMTALGKLIGGGLPVGAFGGRADIMAVTDPLGDMKVALAGTFNANPMTAAAGVAGLRLLTPEVCERIDHLGRVLREGLSTAVAERGLPLRVEGGGSLLSLACDPDVTRPDVLLTGLALAFGNRGVFGFPFLSTSSVMEERHVDDVLETGEEVFAKVAPAL